MEANPYHELVLVEDGKAAVPTGPGLGRDPDPEVLRRYQVAEPTVQSPVEGTSPSAICHCEERSDEAIPPPAGDCFVATLLAMTGEAGDFLLYVTPLWQPPPEEEPAVKITKLRTQVVHLPIDPPILTAILGTICLGRLRADLPGDRRGPGRRGPGVDHQQPPSRRDPRDDPQSRGYGGRAGSAPRRRAERAGLEGAELPGLRGRFDRRAGRDRHRAVGPARQGGRPERCAPDRRLPRRGAVLCLGRAVAVRLDRRSAEAGGALRRTRLPRA